MRKEKNVLVVTILIVVVIVSAIPVFLFFSWQPSIAEFDLEKYRWEIENCSSQTNVGPVDDADTAIDMAKELWVDSFQTESYNPINGRQILVFYDSVNMCWLIKGTLPAYKDGAVPNALIQKDGKVLAVWVG